MHVFIAYEMKPINTHIVVCMYSCVYVIELARVPLG